MAGDPKTIHDSEGQIPALEREPAQLREAEAGLSGCHPEQLEIAIGHALKIADPMKEEKRGEKITRRRLGRLP